MELARDGRWSAMVVGLPAWSSSLYSVPGCRGARYRARLGATLGATGMNDLPILRTCRTTDRDAAATGRRAGPRRKNPPPDPPAVPETGRGRASQVTD